MKKLIIIALTAVATSTAAYAADSSNGCGLGWEVTSSTTLSATTTRETTNTTLPNTFSMTSGSSGCAKHPIAKKDERAFEYVVMNYDSLTVEMAQGQGENLAALARTLGCGDESIALFGEMARSQYSNIVGNGSIGPSDLFDNIKGQLESHPALSIACRS